MKDSQTQEKPFTLNREHSALQNMKSHFFSIFWVISGLLDPDPADYNQCGSRSDPDPQYELQL
jgi:hypothetical protein